MRAVLSHEAVNTLVPSLLHVALSTGPSWVLQDLGTEVPFSRISQQRMSFAHEVPIRYVWGTHSGLNLRQLTLSSGGCITSIPAILCHCVGVFTFQCYLFFRSKSLNFWNYLKWEAFKVYKCAMNAKKNEWGWLAMNVDIFIVEIMLLLFYFYLIFFYWAIVEYFVNSNFLLKLLHCFKIWSKKAAKLT